MTKGHKSGRHELKPSLVGHKAPARRVDSDAPSAADKEAQRGGPELGQDVDCVLPDSDLVRNTSAAHAAPKSAKRPSARAHKPRSGPDR